MQVRFHAKNHVSPEGIVSGGVVAGTGFTIAWQDGPLGRGEDRMAPNGAFVEDVIAAAASRLKAYQASPFECQENEIAIDALMEAIKALESRTARREAKGIEGTHQECID